MKSASEKVQNDFISDGMLLCLQVINNRYITSAAVSHSISRIVGTSSRRTTTTKAP